MHVWHLSSVWGLRDAKKMLDDAVNWAGEVGNFEEVTGETWCGYELHDAAINANLERAWGILAEQLEFVSDPAAPAEQESVQEARQRHIQAES